MITKKKKYTLYYVMALACGLAASFFIYSCSADGYYSDEIEKNEVTNTRALSSRMINNGSTLIDSIASSDEFWEFEMSSELLADKFHEYTSTLSEEEYDKLMENLNDDDYVEDFMRKANLENELQQLAKAKENLIKHTGFLRLSADERIVLIIGAIDTFPQNKYSNKRVWFYYAIMGGFISAIHSFIGLINILEIT